MATKTQSRQGGKASSGSKRGAASDKSAFSFGNSNTGILVGAAVAGAAMGMAANVGRKLFVQFSSGASGDWLDALKAEHELALAIFDKIEATQDDQVQIRTLLLMKLKYALDKHAVEEENVIYPALRQANSAHDADALTSEHGYVKTYLYELEALAKDSPEWLTRVRDFRSMIEEHMRMEEEEIFPAFRANLSEDQNRKLTARMNKEGFKVA
ncbi:hemerythrin domain-containing protein [Sphingosinicella rhizophila]|uniref:Hemerythrin domain-containing protein n=1 Tax=Sphingosinicella rhizophila TaxID=3050082 RepID=A0ABU3Q2T7_9SPHN|nr:hemerythrin domain-containing protein [Sphingosinicella sp. GR2756]MDT9597602.1 hemerythrin domain-containing protein [Sphingosinicella sp. GR2756]